MICHFFLLRSAAFRMVTVGPAPQLRILTVPLRREAPRFSQ
jgi:hypothetical protein